MACTASKRSPSKRYSISQYSTFSVKKRAHLGPAEIDRRSPRCMTVLAKELRCVEMQVVPVRPEVIVDHVEKDHQPMVVRGIDQRLQVVGRPVGGIGRIRQHAIIAPVAQTREIVDRHQFDRGDAECRQPGKLPRHTAESAEDSGMQFVQHGLAPRPSAPGGVAPRVAARIDHDAWIVHIIRLRARRGIRHQHSVRQTIAIPRSVRARRRLR